MGSCPSEKLESMLNGVLVSETMFVSFKSPAKYRVEEDLRSLEVVLMFWMLLNVLSFFCLKHDISEAVKTHR
jgi:hypothetical protein